MRILIVNVSLIGDDNATGVTMQNMLYGMNNIDYMQYCLDSDKLTHSEMVNTKFLETDDVLIDKLVNMISKSKATEIPIIAGVTSNVNYNKYRDFLKGLKDSSFCRLSKKTKKAIFDFKPDVIYTTGGNIRVLNQAYKISKQLNIPIIFHCMDDWRTVIYAKSFIVKPVNKWLNYRINCINKRTVINLAICEKMAKVYEKDYNVPYSYASNCVFNFNEDEYVPKEDNSMLVIFSGGLHFGRANTLQGVAKKIQELNKLGYKINMEIFAPANQVKSFDDSFDYEHTKLFPYVDKEKQMENLKRADVLLHVESDDPTEIKYMYLSFSTKLVEYFAASRTVLGYGTKEMASLSYITDNNCGVVAENFDELMNSLIKLYNDKNLRIQFAKNALRVAKSNHSQKIVQERIYNVFEQNVKNWRMKDGANSNKN